MPNQYTAHLECIECQTRWTESVSRRQLEQITAFQQELCQSCKAAIPDGYAHWSEIGVATHYDAAGYVILSDSRKQHRAVMEALLGRKLTSEEEVHHKNRNRADNSPQNLELWFSSQPAGGRLLDLAIEYLALQSEEYLDSFVAAIRQRRNPQASFVPKMVVEPQKGSSCKKWFTRKARPIRERNDYNFKWSQ